MTGASPQPDPLGHLSSRNRGSIGWRLRHCMTVRPGKLERSVATIPPRKPCSRGQRVYVGLAWPPARPAHARPAGRRNTTRRSACADRAGPIGTDGRRTACAGTATRGPRAASPELPRRRSRSAAPEVPSIDEPPGFRPRAFTLHRPVGRVLPTGCHQPVENTRRP